MSLEFLSLEEVLAIHHNQIDLYGGTHGIRDLGLLQSAIAMPSAGFGGQYLHADIFEMAAAYVFHLSQNQPFLDGNKRTASASAIVFLKLNKIAIKEDQDTFEKLIRQIPDGRAGKSDIAGFFHRQCQMLDAEPSRILPNLKRKLAKPDSWDNE
ncbi:MAG: type II toxin-antitoxin system death-on-curing family toxin [Candidatus Obscuribacterales bacterium]|nr:type II toxin-antitoxin system death-on-curing family toxin [Candidatus Obscuribacterales bacterium]